MTLMLGANSSAVKKLSTNVVKCTPFASRTRPSGPIVNLVLSDIKFGPFCSVQRGSIDPAGSSAPRRIAKATTLPAIHTTETRIGALSSSLRVLALALSRGVTPPRRRTGASDFPPCLAAWSGKRGDPVRYPPFSDGSPHQLPIGSSLLPVGLGPRIACCVVVLRRRLRVVPLPPAPFYSLVI